MWKVSSQPKHDWSIPQLDASTHDTLDRVFLTGPLQRFVVRFKFWHPDGTIFYSSNHAQIGQRSTIDFGLAAAFRGDVRGRVSALDDANHERERELGPHLLEVFIPVRLPNHAEVAAVAEFYYSMESVDRDIREAQLRSWWVVALGTVACGCYYIVWCAGPAIRSSSNSVICTAS